MDAAMLRSVCIVDPQRYDPLYAFADGRSRSDSNIVTDTASYIIMDSGFELGHHYRIGIVPDPYSD